MACSTASAPRRARAAAAARDLHLEPAARPRLAARSLGRADRAGSAAAELHIYAGPAVYGGTGTHAARRMEAVLARADALRRVRGAPLRAGRARRRWQRLWPGARVMLYRGDPGETFCLALAEAQAMGVPAVVEPLGSVPERVIDGVTGRVATDDDGFVAAAVALLRDDDLWRRWHLGALERQRGLSWDEVAARYEALIRAAPFSRP